MVWADDLSDPRELRNYIRVESVLLSEHLNIVSSIRRLRTD
jgi:hypothetical protein